nr:aromatic amino acid DMT transporter YddG [uncultured Desulfobacter sp.]
MAKQNDSGKAAFAATIGGLFAILLWSFTIAFTRSISEHLGPVYGAGYVYLISAVFGLINVLRSSKQRRKLTNLPQRYLWGCGSLFVGYMLFLFLAVGLAENRSQSLEIGLINYLWPALILVFSVPILKNKASWLLLPGTGLALFGVFLVVTGGGGHTWHTIFNNLSANPMAYLLALFAALSWGLYSNLTRKWVGPDQAGGAVPFFLAATAVALFFMNFFVNEPRNWSLQVAGEVAALAFVTLMAYSLWDNAMRKGNTIFLAASSYMTPLLSTIVSCIYLCVAPTPSLWIGCGLLIAGSLISWVSVTKERN